MKYTLVLFALIFTSSVLLNAQTKTQKKIEVGLDVKLTNSSSIYNSNSEEQVKDTLFYEDKEKDKIIPYPYTTDMSQQSYILNFACHDLFSDNFGAYLNIKFPFVNTSIEEKFSYDSLDFSRRYTKNKDSYFCLSGAEVEMCLVKFDLDLVSFNFFTNIFVPFYKYKENSDSTNEIINNKKIELGRNFESSYGANINLNLKSIKLGLTGVYENRTGDFTDKIITNFHFGFSNVDKTELYLDLDYATSLGEYKPEYKISQWRSLLWEKYFDVGVGFNIFFTDYLFTEIAYKIRLWGENTIVKNTVNINLKYLFNL